MYSFFVVNNTNIQYTNEMVTSTSYYKQTQQQQQQYTIGKKIERTTVSTSTSKTV